jgi:hypothetical protein
VHLPADQWNAFVGKPMSKHRIAVLRKLALSYVLGAILVAALIISTKAVVAADEPGNPSDPGGVLDPMAVYNNLLTPAKLPSSAQAAAVAGTGRVAGTAIAAEVTNLANGATLSYPNVPKPIACLNFNNEQEWASQVVRNGVRQGSPWNDHYSGWGASAEDDGGYYRSQSVTFSKDATVGNVTSMKVASGQPYAARIASPLIPVQNGDEVSVTVRYLLANILSESPANDWVSLGIKRDAAKANNVVYVNGYTRGKWAELSQTVAAEGDHIMVLLQAQSPAAIDSNVYFDDVEIFIGGKPVLNCGYEASFSGH